LHAAILVNGGLKTSLRLLYDQDDVKVAFTYQCGPAPTFCWPHRENICWVPTENILSVIDIFAPLLEGTIPSVVTLLMKLQKT